MSTDAKPTILVVDDEPDIVELITYNLQGEGYRVLSASDGAQALEITKAQLPDLVVLDVMMPKLSGIEVAKRLRAQSETSTIPIIMLTAKSAEADELEGLGVGADDYVTKPFSMQILLGDGFMRSLADRWCPRAINPQPSRLGRSRSILMNTARPSMENRSA